MAELDSLLDSLMLKNKIPEVSYVDDQDVKTLKVNQIPSKGDGLSAERLLPVSNPICSLSYPATMAIDSHFVPTVCYYCLVVTATDLPLPSYGHTHIDLKTCNGCHFARFCGRECQVKAWRAYHKHECKIFKKLKNNQLHAIERAVLRAVLLKDRDLLPSEDWDRITSLVAHEEFLAAGGRSNLTEMAEGIKHLAESSMTIEMIQRIIFIMRANATELPTTLNGAIGVMLIPLVAKFNHSCEPNVAIYRPWHTINSGWMDTPEMKEDERKTFARVIPLRDIQVGEELLICYVDTTASVQARKAKLKEEYFFECNCSRCLLDIESHIAIANEQPDLPSQYEKWTQDVRRHISQPGRKSGPAATAMGNSEQYLQHPVLYTSGEYPDLARTLILQGLKNHAYVEALVNALRLYFLVNPQRFVGRHNPTNIYTIFLLLDIFDALLAISTPPEATKLRIDSWLQTLESRGLSRSGLVYWRQRICTDLIKRLEGSAAKDLCVLAGERQKEVPGITGYDNDARGEEFERIAEGEMRDLLRLEEPQWRHILNKTIC